MDYLLKMSNWITWFIAWLAPWLGVFGVIAGFRAYLQLLDAKGEVPEVDSIGEVIYTRTLSYLRVHYRALLLFSLVVFLLIVVSRPGVGGALLFAVGVICSTLVGLSSFLTTISGMCYVVAIGKTRGAGPASLEAYKVGSIISTVVAGIAISIVGFLFYFLGAEQSVQQLSLLLLGISLVCVYSRLVAALENYRPAISLESESFAGNSEQNFNAIIFSEIVSSISVSLELFLVFVSALVGGMYICSMIPEEEIRFLFVVASDVTNLFGYRYSLVALPLALSFITISSCLVAQAAPERIEEQHSLSWLRSLGLIVAGLFLGGSFLLFLLSSLRIHLWIGVVFGVATSLVVFLIGEYFTSSASIRELRRDSSVVNVSFLQSLFSWGLKTGALLVLLISSMLLLAVVIEGYTGVVLAILGMVLFVPTLTASSSFGSVVNGGVLLDRLLAYQGSGENTQAFTLRLGRFGNNAAVTSRIAIDILTIITGLLLLVPCLQSMSGAQSKWAFPFDGANSLIIWGSFGIGMLLLVVGITLVASGELLSKKKNSSDAEQSSEDLYTPDSSVVVFAVVLSVALVIGSILLVGKFFGVASGTGMALGYYVAGVIISLLVAPSGIALGLLTRLRQEKEGIESDITVSALGRLLGLISGPSLAISSFAVIATLALGVILAN